MNSSRPRISVEALLVLGLLYMLAAFNRPFWHAALAGRDGSAASTWGFAAAVAAAIAAVSFVFLAPLATRRTVRPLLAVLFIASASASHYMEQYGVHFDRTMLANVMATHWGEARELLDWRMAARVLVLGVLPAAALWWPQLVDRRPVRALLVRTGWAAAAMVLAVASLLPVFADVASITRNHKEVRYLLTPGNLVAAGIGNVWGRTARPAGPRVPVGADARLEASWAHRQRPTLFVLVVGETARAQNFSLNGYPRPTNPELSRRDIVNYSNAWACGTSTEVSLPCMFSPFGRRNYDEGKILSHESLLHVLARAGFNVLWRDNQSGCKGVCAGLPAEQLDRAGVEGLCPEGQCLDEVLLHGMDRVLKDRHGNVFVVMHQLGSHGPAYYRRYPAAFRRFVPTCDSDDLRRCTPEQIRNSYDNSLLYTDHFVARVIDELAARQDRYDTAMLYVSDHGESLGDNGLYLHGMPYAVAPDVQRRVPMLAWFSPGFRQSFGVDPDCLRAGSARQVSHDNLFHSLLGVLDVRTTAYERDMDLFAGCRKQAALTPAPAPDGERNAP